MMFMHPTSISIYLCVRGLLVCSVCALALAPSKLPVRVYHMNPQHEDPPGGMWCLPNLLGSAGADAEQSCVLREDVHVPGVEQVFLLRGVLSPERCAALVTAANSVGFVHPPEENTSSSTNDGSRRNGALSWILDEATSATLFARVAPWLPDRITTHQGSRQQSTVAAASNAHEGATWLRRADGAPEGTYTLAGLNQRSRLYQYRSGSEDEFPAHIDEVWPGSSLEPLESSLGKFQSEEQLQLEKLRLKYDSWTYGPTRKSPWEWTPGARVSQLSFLLYLSSHDGVESDNSTFAGVSKGGETLLYSEDSAVPAQAIPPRCGDALVFGQSFRLGRRGVRDTQHALLHAGAPLLKELRGDAKYVLRSDVMYRLPEIPLK